MEEVRGGGGGQKRHEGITSMLHGFIDVHWKKWVPYFLSIMYNLNGKQTTVLSPLETVKTRTWVNAQWVHIHSKTI